MHELDFLRDVVILLIAAVLLVFIFQRMKASPVLGYLVAGVLIGPHAIGLIPDVEGTKALAELGVVFLLFSIGLELSFKRLANLRVEVFGLGTAQVVLTGIGIGLAAWALGATPLAAIVIGSGLALSSTAIVLQLLSERGELSSRMGRTTFSILLLQDLAIVPLLAMVPLLGAGNDLSTDWRDIAVAIGTAAGALVAILVLGRLFFRPLFRAIATVGSKEVFVAITLLVILGAGYLTSLVGLSLTLGAFLAGLLLSETEFKHQIEVDISPFQGLLLGLFFITVGMEIDLGFAVANWWQVLLLVSALIAFKAVIVFGLARLISLDTPLALRTGLTLAQGGEFAFVLISVAVVEDVVPRDISQMVLVVVSISMALTPFLATLGKLLSERTRKVSEIGLASMEHEHLDLEGHVIIAGYGRFGRMIGDFLDKHHIPYAALDVDPHQVAASREKGKPVHYGDVSRPELLWAVGVDRAKAIVLTATQDPERAVEVVRHIRQKLPDMNIIARAKDRAHAHALRKAGANFAIPDTLASSLHMAQTVLKDFGLERQDLSSLIDEHHEKEADQSASEKAAS